MRKTFEKRWMRGQNKIQGYEATTVLLSNPQTVKCIKYVLSSRSHTSCNLCAKAFLSVQSTHITHTILDAPCDTEFVCVVYVCGMHLKEPDSAQALRCLNMTSNVTNTSREQTTTTDTTRNARDICIDRKWRFLFANKINRTNSSVVEVS